MLWPYVKPYTKKIIFLCFLSVIYSSVTVATPWIYKTVFDELIPHYSYELLLILCGFIIFIYLISMVINMITHTLLIHIRSDFAKALRLDAMDGFLDYPFSFYQQHPSSTLIGLVGADMEKLGELVYYMLRFILAAIQIILILGFILFFLEVKIFLLFLSVPIIYFCWSFVFRKLSVRYNERSLLLRDTIYKYCYEIFPTIIDIKCYGLYSKRNQQLKTITSQQRHLSAKISLFETLVDIGALLPVRLSLIALFIFGYYGIVIGDYTPGYIITTLVYAGSIVHPMETLFNSFSACYFSWHIRNKVRPYLGLKRESPRGFVINELNKELCIRNLNFSYPARKTHHKIPNQADSGPVVLKALNLTIPAGSICTVVGSTGAGKTTLVSLLVKLQQAPRGSIFFDGTDIRDIQIRSLRSLVGVVTQEPYIINDSLRINIDPEAHLSDDRILGLCSEVKLDALLARLPQGLDTLLLERGQNLSGGEKQRVVLARRLARGNRVMILDEITSALDMETEADIINTIQRLRKDNGTTFIGISHRLALAKSSDRIFVLERGRVVEEGTHAELIAGQGRYHELFHKSLEYGRHKKPYKTG